MKVNASIFRAYDIRGVVGQDLTEDVARLVGKALATLYPQCTRVVVGRDGRTSSPALAKAVTQGLVSAGVQVIDVGEVPTPVTYYATHELQTGSGIMVTGSHNPPEYNGLKISMDGRTLFGELIQAIHSCIETGKFRTGQGSLEEYSIVDQYIERISKDVILARPMRIAIDCGNGVAGPTALRLFKRMGCDVTALYCDIDGTFPNHHPNPSEPENLQDLRNSVLSGELDLGLAFDGDGDRVGVLDDHGEVLWADRQMMLYARDVLSRNPGADIIYDVKSSRSLGDVIRDAGGNAIMWRTGHSFIKSKMAETGALLAGEMSGHIFFKERWYGFDDGLYAAARLLEIVARDERPCHQQFAQLPKLVSTPEITLKLSVDGAQHDFMQAFSSAASFPGATISTIDGVRADFDYGWGLVRASNTTPSLVLRFEAEDEAGLAKLQQMFKNAIASVDASIAVPF